ncbi:hypothetical protein VaNZ11_000662 [Volvox africanus]|uniref:Uncharacterized protein n=1 Tax=Volvox africanus TaxID=51714 RepID=A0ABQ5RNW6_9CHLO|nr:hypothetical protein VaNZ11_000662 [Volvox africanus]
MKESEMPTLEPANLSAKGPGQEIMDEISSAQQYVLDLQVLFYSLKTVTANAQKEAHDMAENVALASAGAAANGPLTGYVGEPSSTGQVHGSHGGNGTGSAVVTAALQKHIEDLTQQLESERKERAKLQEQYDQAVVMLRKSYGQIVDDYLFATEQLHVRTKQLEGLMETAAAPPTSDQQQTRVHLPPANYVHRPTETLPQPQRDHNRDQQQQQLRNRYQGQVPVCEEPSESWDAYSPDPATDPAGYGEGLIANLVDTAAAALAAAAAAVSAAAPHPTSFPPEYPQSALATDRLGRRLTGAGSSGPLATSAPGGGVRTSSSSQSCSRGSNASDGEFADVATAAERAVVAGPPEQLLAEEQAFLATQRSGKHADDDGAVVLDNVCSGLMLIPGSQSTRPKAQILRTKVQTQLPHDEGPGPAETPPPALSSPHGTSQGPTPREIHGGTSLVAAQQLPQRTEVAAAAVAAVPQSQVVDDAGAEASRRSSTLHWEAAESLLAFAMKRTLPEHVAAGAKYSCAPVDVETNVLGSGLESAEPADGAVTPSTGRPDLTSARSASGVGPAPYVGPRPEPSARLGTATVDGVNGAHATPSFETYRAGEYHQPRVQDGLQKGGGGASSLRNSELHQKQGRRHHYPNCDTDREREQGREQSARQRSGGGASDAGLAAVGVWAATANSAEKRPEAGGARVFGRPRLLSEETNLTPVAVDRVADQPDEAIWQSPVLGSSASRNAQAAALAAASELRSAAASASAERGRWDSVAADWERRGDHREGGRKKDGRGEDRPISSVPTCTAVADDGMDSTNAQDTPSKGYPHHTPASRRPDADGTHGGRIATGSTSQNAAKRLRRSISSPAEHLSRSSVADAHAREMSVGPAHDANIAAFAMAGFQSSNRVTSRVVPPPEPSSISHVARRPPAVAAAVAESPQKRGGGCEGSLPSRKQSLRNVQSVPTPGSSELGSTSIAYTARDAQGIERETVSVGAAAMQRLDEEVPDARGWSAGGGIRTGAAHRPHEGSRVNDDAAENSTIAAGVTAATAASVLRVPSGLEPEPGKVLPLELDTYLLRLRAKSAAAGLGVAVGVEGSQGTANTSGGEAAGLFGMRRGGREAVAATGGVFPSGPSRVAASASAVQGQVQETATDAGAFSVDSSFPSAAAAATSGVFVSSNVAAAKAVAAAATAAATNTPVGAAVRTNGEGCSTTSSPSIEGLASLMRNLRRKLANMAEYNFGVEELTDDVTEGADDAAGDWLTDDEVDPEGGQFGDDDDDDDDVESVLLGMGLGAGVAGSYTPYASGGDISADDDDGSGQNIDTGDNDNDVTFGTYDRLYSGTYGTADIAATRRVAGAAAAGGTNAAGIAHREGDDGAPQAQARGCGGAGIINATSGGSARQFSGPWFAGSASAGSSDAGTPGDSRECDTFGDGAGLQGMEGSAYGNGNYSGSGKVRTSFLDRSRHPQGAAATTPGGKSSSPGAGRQVGTEARASGISCLLGSVNAAMLGSVGSARGATRAPNTAAPATDLVQEKVVTRPKRTPPPQSATVTARVPAAAGAAAGAIATTEERGCSVKSQPDRMPPTDQISPRKDSAVSFGRTASGKVPLKWGASDKSQWMGPRAAGSGAVAEADPDGCSFARARWASGSGFEQDAAGAGHTNAKIQNAEAGSTIPAAAVPNVSTIPTVSTSSAASPQLQNLRSEAMFARITQRLDALQNTVSQGLSLPRGTDDMGRAGSRAGSSASSGGGSGGGGYERGAEYRSAAAAAAAAAAWKGDASWRASSGGAQEARDSGSGGGSRGSQGSTLGTNNGDGGMRRDTFRSSAATPGAGAT